MINNSALKLYASPSLPQPDIRKKPKPALECPI